MPEHRRSDAGRHQGNRLEGLSGSEEGMVLLEQTGEWKWLQAEKERLEEKKRDLTSQKLNLEEQRDKEIEAEENSLREALKSENERFNQDRANIIQAVTQDGNDSEQSNVTNQLNSRIAAFYATNRSLTTQSIARLNDIQQRYQPGINAIQATLFDISMQRLGLSVREHDLRSAFAERTPSPPLYNVHRWQD